MSKQEHHRERRNFLATAIKVAASGGLVAALPGDLYARPRSGQFEALENSDSVAVPTDHQPLIFAGRTTPGATNWKPYPFGAGVFVEVETNLKTKVTPIYIVSLGGRTNHWATTGGDCVYPINPESNLPDASGFRINVNWESGTAKNHPALTPALVNTYGWHINWIAIVNG